MPASGWKAVGVSVRESEYPILMERLKDLGFSNLQQLVKALIEEGDFTSKLHNFTSKELKRRGKKGGKKEELWSDEWCRGRASNPRLLDPGLPGSPDYESGALAR